MITKKDARGASVDWETVNKRSEIARTYLFMGPEGQRIFKLYKPSQMRDKNISKKYRKPGWKWIEIGMKDRSGKSHADKKPKQVFRERHMKEMLDEHNRAYCY